MNFEIILILILWVVLAVVCTLVVYSVCTLTYTFDLLHRSLKTHNKLVILFLSTRWWLCKHFHNKEDVTFIHFNLDNMKTFSVLTLSKHSKGKRKPKWTYLNSPTHNIPYFDEASWNSSPKVYPPMTIWLKKKTKWILEAFFLAVRNWLTQIDCFLSVQLFPFWTYLCASRFQGSNILRVTRHLLQALIPVQWLRHQLPMTCLIMSKNNT